MMWILAWLLAVAAGAMLARVAFNANDLRAWVASVSLGALIGPGLLSAAWFALPPSVGGVWTLSALLFALSAFVLFRFRGTATPATNPSFAWTWLLSLGVLAGIVLLVLNFRAITGANPNGDWDAITIWNLRARFIASGPSLWSRALVGELGGNMLGAAHHGYPLFLSSYLAGLWSVSGGFPPEVSSALSLSWELATVGLVIGALRTPALGFLAGLVLLATDLFTEQVASQYSDTLLGLSFLGSLVLLHAASESRRTATLVAAGLAVGFSAWIKNEGGPFAVAALFIAIWRFRGQSVWVCLGALPGVIATGAVKLMAPGTEQMFPATVSEALGKVLTLSRWVQIAEGFGSMLISAGTWWAHPILLVAALAFALRFIESPKKLWWLAIPLLAAFSAEFGVYLITAADLTWHISTSVSRLVAQLWPAAIFCCFCVLRAPEEFQPVQVAKSDAIATKPGRKKRS